MAQDLLTELHQRGIRLRLSEGGLDVLAPTGALTPQLRDELRLRRDDLIALLRRAEAGGDVLDIRPQPAQRYEPFPLTDIQHAYWVGRNPAVELGGVFTHYYLELDGDGLDLDRLNASLRKVIARHDMLRAVVTPDGRQRFLPEVPAYEIAVTDLRELDDAARNAELAAVRDEMSHRSLPPETWPLFEVRASRTTGTRLRLHLNFDNLIVDAASLYVLFHDWRHCYERPEWAAEPPELSYRDYVVALEAQRDGGRYKAAERYWLDRAETLPPAPELPLAVQPAQVSRPRFTRRTGRLPRDRWARLKRAARGRGLTPSTLTLAAFAEVLRLWSKQPAFTLNLTLFNRPQVHPQVGQVVGDFTSVTLLEVPEPGGESFAARAGRLNRQLMRDLEHLSYGGVRVLQERARRLGGAPGAGMPVVFTSALSLAAEEDAAPDTASDRGFFGELGYALCETPQVWLDHQVTEENGDLVHNWDVVEELFPPGLLDDVFAVYRDLLDRLATDEAAWDRVAPLVAPPSWQLARRHEANETAAAIPARTLCGLVEQRARQQPYATAVLAADGQLSYRELVGRARRLARRLIDLGAARDTLIGVVLEKGVDQAVAVLGVTLSGAAYLPIDAQWPDARRDRLLDQGGVRVAVTSPGLRDELAWPAGLRLVTPADPEVGGADAGPLPGGPSPDDLAYVIFTSGSTGQPKGVMIDHRGAANTVQDINARFAVGQGDRVLALSALSFDLSVYDIFGTLAAGGTVVMPDPSGVHDPAHWSDLVARHRVSVWNSVPALMRAWMEAHPPAAAPPGLALRLVLLSGDWIPVTLPDAIRTTYPTAEVISLGGATEASIWSVFHPIGKVPPEMVRIPYGRPLANQTMHVYDRGLLPRAVWAVGEIYIGGTGVARGYWADPERTAERFVVHPATGERLYRTGDLGRYLPGGDIEFLGREDFQVKLNGYRIELGEIQAELCRLPGVAEAMVTVDTNPETGARQLVAYVVPAAGTAAPEAAALRTALGGALPEYLVPRHYLVIERLPLSANGKVDPSALPRPWAAATGTATDQAAGPRDDLERLLLDIWRETLGRDDVGVDDNLFELGGDSLHAVRILGQIRDELGVEQSAEEGLSLLFDSPTITELARTLRERAEGTRT